MKKKILKNVAILTFALFGLGIIGSNVIADDNCTHGGPGSSSCSVTWTQGFLGFKFSGGCSISCGSGYYACCHVGDNNCDCIKNEPNLQLQGN